MKERLSVSARLHIVITIAVMVFIFVHSAMPGELSGNESRYFAEILAAITGIPDSAAEFVVRKAAHFTEFAVLGACLSLDLYDFRLTASGLNAAERSAHTSMLIRHPVTAAWIAGTLYAGTDEFHQLFVTGRSGELRDVCIDSAGGLLGVIICYAVYCSRSKN